MISKNSASQAANETSKFGGVFNFQRIVAVLGNWGAPPESRLRLVGRDRGAGGARTGHSNCDFAKLLRHGPAPERFRQPFSALGPPRLPIAHLSWVVFG